MADRALIEFVTVPPRKSHGVALMKRLPVTARCCGFTQPPTRSSLKYLPEIKLFQIVAAADSRRDGREIPEELPLDRAG
jgi:hypothetical protein